MELEIQVDDEVDASTSLNEREYRGVEEAVAACRDLSADEGLKLMAIEARLAEGTGRARTELFAEAMLRIALGKRRWPTDVTFIAFFVMVMKSIASHDRDRRKTENTVEYDENEVERSRLPDNPFASNDENPEAQLIAAEDAKRPFLDVVLEHLDSLENLGDRDEMKLLVMGLDDDLRGKDLRDAIGVDQSQLDYLKKKLRRIMIAAYPKGYRQ